MSKLKGDKKEQVPQEGDNEESVASTAQRPIETSHLTENPPIHSSQRNSLADAAMQDPPILIDSASKIRSAGSPQQEQE